jgi:hypothetical protein
MRERETKSTDVQCSPSHGEETEKESEGNQGRSFHSPGSPMLVTLAICPPGHCLMQQCFII